MAIPVSWAIDPHPADSNANQRIDLVEIEAYWNTGLAGLSDAEKKSNVDW